MNADVLILQENCAFNFSYFVAPRMPMWRNVEMFLCCNCNIAVLVDLFLTGTLRSQNAFVFLEFKVLWTPGKQMHFVLVCVVFVFVLVVSQVQNMSYLFVVIRLHLLKCIGTLLPFIIMLSITGNDDGPAFQEFCIQLISRRLYVPGYLCGGMHKCSYDASVSLWHFVFTGNHGIHRNMNSEEEKRKRKRTKIHFCTL